MDLRTEHCLQVPTLDVSICIIAYKRKDILLQCIQSVKDTIAQHSYEILVCDNCSEDGTQETLQRDHPDVRVVVNSTNVGFATGNNQLMLVGQGTYFLLLNNDCLVTTGAIDTMLETMRKQPDAAMIGPKMFLPDGTLWPSFKNRWEGPLVDFSIKRFGREKRQHRILATAQDAELKQKTMEAFAREHGYNVSHEVNLLLGACILVRREFITECGLMDERYFMYREDSDWCLRARRAGWKLWYCHTAIVYHHHVHRTARKPEFARLLAPAYYESQMLFCKSHFGWMNTAALAIILLSITSFRILRALLQLLLGRTRASASQDLQTQSRVLRIVWKCLFMQHQGSPKATNWQGIKADAF